MTEKKGLILKSGHNAWIALFLLFVGLIALPELPAAKIEFDIFPASTTFNVENLNQSGGVVDLENSQQTTASEVTGPSVTPVPDFLSKIAAEFPHIFTLPRSSQPTSSLPNATIPEVMQPPFSETTLEGKGEKELVALRDGGVTIKLLLSTYSQASMEAHLYDPDGSEVWFKGSSLLSWHRLDSRQNSPLQFKGTVDSTSMRLEGSGDYGPADDLSYSFDIKEGQKLVIKTYGNAEPRSFIKVSGSAF
ncbi:MAG: hypothetical protein CVV42_10510 [Candidatus Riflebacteria bacterium HGW-Riflebacteria-2]|nr:MAG: hypothetical protein CVV42_10510 [Candidatus Riflebacteria bacterium HGW-Riflebacteria-2]